MVNELSSPIDCPWRRSTVLAKEWKVPPATCSQRPSISADARRIISEEALRVKVSSSTLFGSTPSSTRRATRNTRVRVFPVPAPATTSTGPAAAVTASYCAGFSRDW
jgi:hypothetical protein